ncbi:MAG: hypothetical protein WBD36_05615 [Bacteroidota bacterium]
MNRTWFCTIALSAPALLSAQIVSLQTTPFFGSDQLTFYPSTNLKAAGISIAAEDQEGDQFTNPACGSSIRGLTAFSVPTFVAVGKSAEASLISLGVRLGNDSFFAGMYAGRQRANDHGQDYFLHQSGSSDRSGGTNDFGHVFVGYRVPGTGTALGASFFRTDIGFLAKFNSAGMGYGDLKRGSSDEYRIGIEQRNQDGRRFDLVLARAVTGLDYGYYPPYYAGPVPADGLLTTGEGHDRSATWAIQSHYVQPVSQSLFLGALVDVNWKEFAELMLFEGPARATAIQLGLGIARVGGESVLGFDVIYEPASVALSWLQELPNDDVARLSSTVQFSNWTGKVGIRTDRKPLNLSFGLQLHAVRFHVREQDENQATYADMNEGWNEWRFTIGLTARLFGLELDYTGILTTFKPINTLSYVTDTRAVNTQQSIDIIRPFYSASFYEGNSILHRLTITVSVF